MRNSRDRTVSFILAKLLKRKKLHSMEDLILTTLSIYKKFLQLKFKFSEEQTKIAILEAKEQIEKYLKIKLYGYPSLKAYYINR